MAKIIEAHRLLDIGDEFNVHLVGVALLPGDQLLRFSRQERLVAQGDRGRLAGHRRIDIDLERRHAAVTHQIGQHIEHLLRPPDGKCRNDHIAALLVQRVMKGLDDFVERLVQLFMQAIAVSRFDEQNVRFVDQRRIVQHRSIGLAEVAGKHQLAGFPAVLQPQLDDRRAENMPGVTQTAAYTGCRNKGLAVSHRPQLLQAGLRLGHRIERRLHPARRCRLAITVTQNPLAFLLLNVRTVEQQHLQQIDGRRRRVDRPLVAEHGQAWQQARVVDVRVCKQHKIDFPDIERQGAQIFRVGVTPALKHAAIDKKTACIALDQKAGTRYFTGCTKKADLHSSQFLPAGRRWF